MAVEAKKRGRRNERHAVVAIVVGMGAGNPMGVCCRQQGKIRQLRIRPAPPRPCWRHGESIFVAQAGQTAVRVDQIEVDCTEASSIDGGPWSIPRAFSPQSATPYPGDTEMTVERTNSVCLNGSPRHAYAVSMSTYEP